MDQVLPFEWGVANNEYFRGLGANVTFETYPDAHTVSLKNHQDFTKWLLDSLKENK